MTMKAQETKTKIKKQDDIKLKRSCTATQTINRMKRQIIEQEKIFANFISDKGSYQKYVKNSYNSIAKKKKKQFKSVQGN